MTNKSVSKLGYTLSWVQPELIKKIADSTAATEKIATKITGTGERLWIRDIIVTCPDSTDTNNVKLQFFVIDSDATADGGAYTTVTAIGDSIGDSFWNTALAGIPQRLPVNFLGEAAEDLICEVTVAAGTPTVTIVAYYVLV